MAKRRKAKSDAKPRRKRTRKNPVLPNVRRSRRRYRRNEHPRRRRCHRNPPQMAGLFTDLGYATVGFVATKLVGNVALPIVGVQQPMARIAMKAGLAYVIAWGGETLLGRRAFTPIFLGAAVEVVQDVVKTFLSPMFPALASPEEQEQMALASYAQLQAYEQVGQDPDQVGQDPDQLADDLEM